MNEYQKYQLRWMIEHGYSLQDLIHQLDTMRREYSKDELENLTIMDLFESWEFESGFNGEIWACEDEFYDCEGRRDGD